MEFNPNKVGFGRHETFALRYSWLTKGFLALQNDPKIFSNDDAVVNLGVGRNMVNAIRFWLSASRLATQTQDGYFSTPLGEAIFDKDGYDPYLEDEATIWLIHWLIATNPEQATAWYWFFNRFHKPVFTSQEASTALLEFAKQNVLGKYSQTTVKNDALVLLRMYARSRGNTNKPLEEALDSPLSILNLVSQAPGGRTYFSHQADREGLPLGIFGFAVTELFQTVGKQALPIDELMYAKDGNPSLGAVFRLTENALITKLERLIQQVPELFELRETAGIHQLYLMGEIEPADMLAFHYESMGREVAA
ncbi:MAG: DUF4007 family protein [Candidatus Sedimenticola sp. (ex Thyasira tokunagai)]